MSVFDRLKSAERALKRELKVYQLVLRDRRTPKLAKLLLGLAVGYALLPFDLIPDFIPVVGYLDDAILLPILVVLALNMIPKEVVEECRIRAKDAGYRRARCAKGRFRG